MSFSQGPRQIPLEYNAVFDARIPVRQLGPERTSRVIKMHLNKLSKLLKCILLILTKKCAKKAPNMAKIMEEMAAIHALPVHPRKGPQKVQQGTFVKGLRQPKGSINVPRPQDPRRRPHPLPPSPPTDPRPARSQIFSLTDFELDTVRKWRFKTIKVIFFRQSSCLPVA